MNKVWEQDKDWFVTRCACNDNDHMIEVFHDHNDDVELTFKCRYRSPKFLNRLKIACKVLFTGELETEGEFIFEDKKHVEDFIEALSNFNK